MAHDFRPGASDNQRPRRGSHGAPGRAPKRDAAATGRANRASGRPERSGGASEKPPRTGGWAERGGQSRGGQSSGGVPRAGGERISRPKPETTPVAFPPIESDVVPADLDRFARRELAGLSKEDAEFVAKHLVMSSRVVDDDPELAHQHALAAQSRAQRIGVVRETVGITAYLTGDFALCLRELRTHRRLSGDNSHVPMMIDAERGLGRPERGIELAREVDRSALSDAVQVELAIALSGCRMDLGQLDQALVELQIPQLDPKKAFSYSPDLFDAYAVVLEDLGRTEEATLWGQRATAAWEALQARQWDSMDDVGPVVDALAGGDESEGSPPVKKPRERS